ncbi:MAG: histidine kinase [Gammaproteobacteria bacterium]|nr:MAG: histidine kinase [Gammaproteobacteria bacterium]
MKKSLFKKIVAVMGIIVCFSGIAAAASKEDAKNMVEKAIKYIEENGMEKAEVAFKDKKGDFINGQLYVFVINFDGLMIIHPIKANLEGKNLNKLRTPDGIYFIQEMNKKSKEDGEGWVDYKWANPETGKVSPKSTYVKRIKGKEMYVGCGVYTDPE